MDYDYDEDRESLYRAIYDMVYDTRKEIQMLYIDKELTDCEYWYEKAKLEDISIVLINLLATFGVIIEEKENIL